MSNNLHRIKISKKEEYRHIQAMIREMRKYYEMKDMLSCQKIILRELHRYVELKNKAILHTYIELLSVSGLINYENLPSDEYKAASTIMKELDLDIARQELQKNELVMGMVYLAQESIKKSQNS